MPDIPLVMTSIAPIPLLVMSLFVMPSFSHMRLSIFRLRGVSSTNRSDNSLMAGFSWLEPSSSRSMAFSENLTSFSVTVNVLPTPFSDVMDIVPFMFSSNILQMESPRPVPLMLDFAVPCEYGCMSVFISSDPMPAPVSFTEKTSVLVSASLSWHAADMVMVPCSFDQEKLYEVQLDESTNIEDAWNSEPFERFRNKMRGACPDCEKKELCMGGCPLMPEIVFCNCIDRKIL